MIKKVFIIFTFVLIIFNVAKVEATSILTKTEENLIKNQEEINEGNSQLTIEVRDLEDCVRIGNVKVLLENKDGTWKKEYITDEEGFIYAKGLKAGEFNVQILEIPEKYILNDMIYTVTIEENSYHGQLIGVYHKVGELLIKCNLKGVTFEVITENCFGTYISDDKGEVYLKNLIVGDCKITPYPLEENIIGEPVTTKILEGETCIVSFINEEEAKEPEEGKSENEETEDKENSNIEIGSEKGENGNFQEEDNIHKTPEDANQSDDINKKEDTNKIEEAENNSKDNKNEDKEIKEDIPQVNNKTEETKNDNEKEELDKNNEERIKPIQVVAEISEEKELINEDKKTEETENTETAEENIQSQSNQTKLPKTGNDYFEVKLIILNSIIFIIFISIMSINKTKLTNSKKSKDF